MGEEKKENKNSRMTSAGDEEEEEMESIVDFIWMFCMTTTVKGIGRAMKSKSSFLKLLWYLATLTGAGMALYFVIDTLVDYHSHETNANFDELSDYVIDFPDVTFCKNNGIGDLENIDGGIRISQYFETLLKYREYFSRESIISLSNQEFIGTKVEETVWDSVASVTGYLENITPEQVQQISNNSMFIQSIRAVDWQWSEIEVEWTSAIKFIQTVSYSVCATISLPPALVNKTRGISVLLYLGETEVIPIPSSTLHPLHSRSTGAACTIHERNTMPDMKQAMFLGPGTESNINIFPTLFARLPTLSEACFENDGSWDPYEFRSNYSYSVEECELMCKAKTIIEDCRCFDASILANRWLEDKNCGALKNFSVVSEDDIVNLIKSQMCLLSSHEKSSTATCDCPVRCEEKHYHPEITQTPWPHPALLRAFLVTDWSIPEMHEPFFVDYHEIMVHEKEGLLGRDEASIMLQEVGAIEKNFLQVNIKFPVEKVIKMTSRYKTTYASLMALIGGNLNLWIGVTFFTFVEVLELVYYTIIYYSKNKFFLRKKNFLSEGYQEQKTVNENVWCTKYTHNTIT